MSFYNVVKPCVVGSLHYARPTTQPIEVDDDVAAPLVESGCLEPYGPRTVFEGVVRTVPDFEPPVPESPVADDEPPTIPPPPRKRGRRSEG